MRGIGRGDVSLPCGPVKGNVTHSRPVSNASYFAMALSLLTKWYRAAAEKRHIGVTNTFISNKIGNSLQAFSKSDKIAGNPLISTQICCVKRFQLKATVRRFQHIFFQYLPKVF